MQSLAVKYRPKTFDEVVGQDITVQLLKKQLEANEIMHSYLFIGSSGCGKTTLARILCNEINQGKGSPIEIDAASHTSVEDARNIIEEAETLPIDCKYKVFIIDECQRLSVQAWDALLKIIEEPPAYTIFMFCTTEINKVPTTIKNRCYNFTIKSISQNLIENRLAQICQQEGFTYDDGALNLIAKKANGGMRQAIAYLDQCKDLSTNITLNVVVNCIGVWNYQLYFDLTSFIITKNTERLFKLIDYVSSIGNVSLFINDYLDFIIQLNMYKLTGEIKATTLPESLKDNLDFIIKSNLTVNLFDLANKILEVKLAIKNDTDPKSTIKIILAGGI